MSRRLGLALATLAAGAGLLVTAAVGFSAAAKSDGILRVGSTGDLDSIDPAIAYGPISWMFEDATAAKLFRYEEGSVVPEVAKRFTVSRNGRVYRFFLHSGYRFSNGEPVRAGSFAYAIKRALNPKLGSPGGSFVDRIVGAIAYSRRGAAGVRGVTASGLTLTIRLVHADPNLLSNLTLPFFQAASAKLPLTEERIYVNRVGDLPTAGPYTWSLNNPNRQANIVRNPYYRGSRGRHVAGVQLDMRLDLNTCFEETKANQLDLGCLPPGQVAGVAQQYGVSRTRPVGTGRFWVKPTGCQSPLLFNHRRSLFSDNARLRQAVNWAVDRTAIAEWRGLYATPWTHILPPGFPGAITAGRLQPYSLRPDLEKARQLAADHLRDGNITVAYQSAGSVGPATAEMVRQALVGLGFDSSRIDMRGFAGFNLYEAISYPNPPFDLVIGVGLCSDSPDPAELLETWLYPGPFSPQSPAYRQKVDALSRGLKGKARLRALGRFDLDLAKRVAPVVVLSASNDLSFFSDRVDPASLRYSPASGWSFTAIRLK